MTATGPELRQRRELRPFAYGLSMFVALMVLTVVFPVNWLTFIILVAVIVGVAELLDR